MNLDELRKLIDEIDEKIVLLLNERCKIAGQVGVWKIENGHPIFVPEREKQLFAKIAKQNNGPLSDKSIINIYREIVSGAIAVEQPLKIACTVNKSVPAMQHHARLTFGDSATYTEYSTVQEVFAAVENGTSDYGVVPFFDGADSFHPETIDALLETGINIVAERKTPERTPTSLVIGAQSPVNTGDDRTAFSATVEPGTGMMNTILDILKEESIDVICCELRISQGTENSNRLFIEAAGHPAEPDMTRALKEIEKLVSSFKLLGGYPLLEH